MTVTATSINTPIIELLDRTAVLTPHVRTHLASAVGQAIPAHCLFIDVTVVGGGGGGSSGGGGDSTGSCGGGSGRVARHRVPRAFIGDTYNVVVGAGGLGGAAVAFGGPSANVGATGGTSSVTFPAPNNTFTASTGVQAPGGSGGGLTAGGAGYSGGGGAGLDTAGGGAGGALGGNGAPGGGGSGRVGGVGETNIASSGVKMGAGSPGGNAGTSGATSLQVGGGGGGGPIGGAPMTNYATDGADGTGATKTKGGVAGLGYGAGGGGGGQGNAASGAGGDGAKGVVVLTFWCGRDFR